MAFLNKGLTITLRDERADHEVVASDGEAESTKPRVDVYHYEGGIVDFVEAPQRDARATAHPTVIAFEAEDTERKSSRSRSRCSGTAAYTESVYTFANTINTHEGGTHEEGFRAALTTLVNKFARDVERAQGEGRRTSPARTSARV